MDIKVFIMSWLLWIVLFWTQECMYLFELNFCLGICPGVGLMDHMVILFLCFWGTSMLFSIVGAPFCIPNTLSNIICRFFNDGHSDWCEVVPHCSLDLPFSNNFVMWNIFSCAFWQSVCLPQRNIYLDPLPMFWLSCLFQHWARKLYILEINPLSVLLFANIFSHSVGCLYFVYGFLWYVTDFN